MGRKIRGSFLAVVGYLLSPLSWWNDLFINIPLAYVVGLIFGLVSKTLFLPGMIVGYWITNVVGFMLMHYGINDIASKIENKYTKRRLLNDVVVSVFYSAVVIVLVKLGWLKFPAEYFK